MENENRATVNPVLRQIVGVQLLPRDEVGRLIAKGTRERRVRFCRTVVFSIVFVDVVSATVCFGADRAVEQMFGGENILLSVEDLLLVDSFETRMV